MFASQAGKKLRYQVRHLSLCVPGFDPPTCPKPVELISSVRRKPKDALQYFICHVRQHRRVFHPVASTTH
jgi:hypothetical protein